MMLTYQHLPQLGDKAVLLPVNAPHVALPYAPPRKRVFPPENFTQVPDFHKMKPCPEVQPNEPPLERNNYMNGWPNSQSMNYTATKESGINNWFSPGIDFRLKAKLLP